MTASAIRRCSSRFASNHGSGAPRATTTAQRVTALRSFGSRIATRNTHGTGCTFSAAIAARLALGAELLEAVRGAKDYLTEAIRRSYSVGRGHGPVDHLHPLTRR